MYYTNTPTDKILLHRFLTNMDEGVTGVTSGCFDITHPLHIQYLEKCKANCDTLIVGVDSDALIYSFKNKLPVYSEHDRAYMVSSLKLVDYTFIMDTITDLNVVLSKLANRYRSNEKGGDYTVRLYKAQPNYYGQPVTKVNDVEVVFIPDVYPINSTTELVRYIQNDYQKL